LIEPVVAEYRPELILVSLGFDAHDRDELASMSLSTAGYADCCRRLLGLARSLCRGRIAFCLEGGYDLEALEDAGEAVARLLLGEAHDPKFTESRDRQGRGADAVERARRVQSEYWRLG